MKRKSNGRSPRSPRNRRIGCGNAAPDKEFSPIEVPLSTTTRGRRRLISSASATILHNLCRREEAVRKSDCRIHHLADTALNYEFVGATDESAEPRTAEPYLLFRFSAFIGDVSEKTQKFLGTLFNRSQFPRSLKMIRHLPAHWLLLLRPRRGRRMDQPRGRASEWRRRFFSSSRCSGGRQSTKARGK